MKSEAVGIIFVYGFKLTQVGFVRRISTISSIWACVDDESRLIDEIASEFVE